MLFLRIAIKLNQSELVIRLYKGLNFGINEIHFYNENFVCFYGHLNLLKHIIETFRLDPTGYCGYSTMSQFSGNIDLVDYTLQFTCGDKCNSYLQICEYSLEKKIWNLANLILRKTLNNQNFNLLNEISYPNHQKKIMKLIEHGAHLKWFQKMKRYDKLIKKMNSIKENITLRLEPFLIKDVMTIILPYLNLQ